VADESNNRISIWTRPDAASTAWSFNAKFGANGSGPGEFQYPSGVFASVDGLTAWVADTGNSRVSIWNRPDSTSTNWTYRAEFGADSLSGPTKLAVSADSLTAWVTNPSYYRIQIWSQF
jgi:DNA-binding beta-propeller fold protein YncE